MEGKMDDEFFKALQQQRKKEIDKVERDLALMDAQRKAFEGEDVRGEKADVLRDGINGARNTLDVLRVAHERALPLQSWERGPKT
jgi:hypothetical protein